MDESTKGYVEKFCTHVEFRTLPKGVPDPPVDVQVELGPQDGSLLVTWLPVTINSQSGKSNGVPVTGYVVYADGRKITEVDNGETKGTWNPNALNYYQCAPGARAPLASKSR